MNFDENTINKLKNMMNKGELNDVISQIPPEMIQNFSSMMNNQTSNNTENTNTNQNNNFDLSQIDMATVLKMKSIMENLNNKNDPRSNLLYSLKPYLREEKRGKVDQYANLLNVAKIADLLKDNNNKENPHNG